MDCTIQTKARLKMEKFLLNLPEKLGEYEFIKEIERDETGVVYKARHLNYDVLCAIKLISSDIDLSSEVRNDIVQEICLQAKFKHENAIEIYDIFDSPPYFGWVMQYMEGISAAQFIKEASQSGESPSIKLAINIGVQCLEALEYFHSQGIIHGAIQPSEILLYIDEHNEINVKIIGVGIAKIIINILRPRSLQLNKKPDYWAYMAPEVTQSEFSGKYDHRSDLYSIGIILFQLLTGKLPQNDSPLVHYDSQPNFYEILKKALDPKPSERFQSASEFKNQLLQMRSIININLYKATTQAINLNPMDKKEPYLADNINYSEDRNNLPPQHESYQDLTRIISLDQRNAKEKKQTEDFRPVKKMNRLWFPILIIGIILAAVFFGLYKYPETNGQKKAENAVTITPAPTLMPTKSVTKTRPELDPFFTTENPNHTVNNPKSGPNAKTK